MMAVQLYDSSNVIKVVWSLPGLTVFLYGMFHVYFSSYDGQSPLKPTGIFGKIAPNRSCDNLLVTEQSKCICQGWETATANSTDQLVYAEFAIGQINNKIQTSLLESRAKGVPYDKSRAVFGTCQRLRVQNIYNVKIRRMRDGTMATTMDVRVQSSNLLKQKELITVQVTLHNVHILFSLSIADYIAKRANNCSGKH